MRIIKGRAEGKKSFLEGDKTKMYFVTVCPRFTTFYLRQMILKRKPFGRNPVSPSWTTSTRDTGKEEEREDVHLWLSYWSRYVTWISGSGLNIHRKTDRQEVTRSERKESYASFYNPTFNVLRTLYKMSILQSSLFTLFSRKNFTPI